ncbi:serine protease [Teredinibacter sp. KSP-S5-2]|uniref:S1 family serine peptidase n=1 Tax=Teredinibacter sp. KSP-S5-2 TaxID=3034506 RepID=UPI0029350602|nr:serine protease [Teredinibacter sp. KSP-S5-2]WNO11092.1 serine protease [Teredinibacter sp. KSP-S5-2]
MKFKIIKSSIKKLKNIPFFLLAISPLSPSWAQDTIQTRVIGGGSSNFSQRSYQVSLQDGSQKHKCGGTLVGERWVISAAHCIDQISGLSIVAGTGDLTNGGQRFQVAQTITHPNYRNSFSGYDIALIQLNRAPSSQLTRLSIPPENTIRAGQTGVVSGWGFSGFGNPNPSNTLQEVNVSVVNKNICVDTFFTPFGFSGNNSILCGGEIGAPGPCGGDSGGPLMINANNTSYLAGVIASGNQCGTVSGIGIYVDVQHVRQWIIDSTNGEVGGNGSSSSTTDCGIPSFTLGNSYNTGDLVVTTDNTIYKCLHGPWCSLNNSAVIFPGSGSHWRQVWSYTGVCF